MIGNAKVGDYVRPKKNQFYLGFEPISRITRIDETQDVQIISLDRGAYPHIWAITRFDIINIEDLTKLEKIIYDIKES
jgi:hypothetical protein